jgi:hypothetical protein
MGRLRLAKFFSEIQYCPEERRDHDTISVVSSLARGGRDDGVIVVPRFSLSCI